MNTHALEKIALSVRALSIDAIEKAASGHPGICLGAAELGAFLYGEALRHDPSAPAWPDRDRFVLSAGHGSMLLYSLLFLAGYPITLDDIKRFRQAGSLAAGHPEYGWTAGVEATTGPLGQGFAMACGMALAETMLAARFNTAAHRVVDHYTYTLVGDGCLEEGISHEAASLAGHLRLGKLIAFYDSNHISIDGDTALSFSDDTAGRFRAYGWQVLSGSMYDFAGLAALLAQAKADPERPSLIILDSIIGKGAPTKQGSADSHGAPLGSEEAARAKEALGIPGDFYVDGDALAHFARKRVEWRAAREAWEAAFAAWSKEYPAKRAEWDLCFGGKALPLAPEDAPRFAVGDKIATRGAGNKALGALAKINLNLVGGSADLKGPNAVGLPAEAGVYSAANRAGRYLHFGVREFAMAAICNGLQLHGGLRAYCATFMVFSDYLRPALRLAALMRLPVVFVFTHDSIFVGEDGPTHQPVEHLASFRAMPGLRVLRPADAEETVAAWEAALARQDGPTVLALSRQTIPVFAKADPSWRASMARGAYLSKAARADGGAEGITREVTVIATGSEVPLALEAAAKAEAADVRLRVRVVSMPCREVFAAQDAAFRATLLPPGSRVVVCEAAAGQGWERFAAPEDLMSLERFGVSAPGPRAGEALGFSADALAEKL
ncbi:MAG: transketolase [Treponema sp.]|jgi:transketolase|nr:transketolase [Treponema sp.]